MRLIKSIKNVDNISVLIDNFTIKLGVSVDNIELKLIDYKTYKKEDSTFEMIDNKMLDDDSFFENRQYEFKQVYDIEVYESSRDSKVSLEVKYSSQMLDMTLDKGYAKPKNIDEFEALYNKIISSMLKNNILLRKLDVQKASLIKTLENLKPILDSKITLNIINSPSFVDSRDSTLEFSYENINLNKKNIICVKENELVAKLYLARNGKAGKNLAGIYITPKNKISTPPTFDEHIKEIQNEDSNSYVAKNSGFVIFDNNHFSFSNELSLQNVELKDNYNFIGDLDSNTKLIITSNNEFEDALKNGTSIMANTIVIYGNISANTNIIARDLQISGQTHKLSSIIATSASINVHKGRLESSIAKITNLEGGSVISQDLDIVKINGGEIKSSNINIIELYSNANIKFANKLIIDSLKGGGNKITFSPLANKYNEEKIQALLDEMDSQIAREKLNNTKLNALIYKYNKYQQTARELKAQIEENAKKNIPTPPYITNNYQAFLNIVESIKLHKKELLEIAKSKDNLTNDIKECQRGIFNAEFLCKDGWLKYNDVIFELVIPKISQSTTIIKGIGRYYFSNEENKIIHQKIFNNNNKEISNKGF